MSGHSNGRSQQNGLDPKHTAFASPTGNAVTCCDCDRSGDAKQSLAHNPRHHGRLMPRDVWARALRRMRARPGANGGAGWWTTHNTQGVGGVWHPSRHCSQAPRTPGGEGPGAASAGWRVHADARGPETPGGHPTPIGLKVLRRGVRRAGAVNPRRCTPQTSFFSTSRLPK